MYSRSKTLLASAIALVSCAAYALAQNNPDAPGFPWEGEVTGANVYIRSGAGNNWYPTAKANAGDRVLVLGEKFGWYQIAPPAGSFSYVDVNMVERKPGAKTGTIKQDKVYVRAGSKLEQRKSSTQVILNKGATVEITGEADGFFQIKPPNGASLFISKQYVKPVVANLRTGLVEKHVSNPEPPAEPVPANKEPPDSTPGATGAITGDMNAAAPTSDTPNPAPQVEPGRTALPTEPVADTATPDSSMTTTDSPGADASKDAQLQPADAKPKSPAKQKTQKTQTVKRSEPAPASPPITGKYKALLTLVEGELADMARRPIEQQDFASVIKRYEPIAGQSEEDIPAQIAKIRIRQLKDRTALHLARAGLEKDNHEIAELRANMDKERLKIQNRRIDAAMVKYDIEGELRESFAFAPENRRFRIVDPQSKVTTAYVDIPANVEGNPRHLIGQLVGIKTSGKKFSPSARVPIAIASELVDLSPRSRPRDEAAPPVMPPAQSSEPMQKADPDTASNDAPESAEPAADAGDKAKP